jgi:hypothetical protein
MLGREVLMPYDLTKEGSSVMYDLKETTCGAHAEKIRERIQKG